MALDFVAGCMGGCAGVLVGHPFDTIKVRLQTQNSINPKYKGTLDCFLSIIRKESASGLYKGMSSPMAGLAVINAIVFGVQGNVQRRLLGSNTLLSHAVAGSIAGGVQCIVCSPMELAKTKMQIQGQGEGRKSKRTYKNPLDCLRKIYHSDGIRGVYRGFGITVIREMPSFGVYFLTFEIMCRNLHNNPDEPIGNLKLMFAGGMSGIASWLSTYPADVIKSRYQADDIGAKKQYKSVFDCAVKGYKQEGIRVFGTGLVSTIIRAFPVNAATFAVVTWTLRIFRRDSEENIEELDCREGSIASIV